MNTEHDIETVKSMLLEFVEILSEADQVAQQFQEESLSTGQVKSILRVYLEECKEKYDIDVKLKNYAHA